MVIDGYEKGRWGKRRQSIHFGRRYTPDPFPISPIPRTDKWWGLFGRRPGYLGLRVGWVSVKNDECWCFISWPKEQNEDLTWYVVYGLQNLLCKGFVPWRWWWWWWWWWWRPRLEVEWCYISMLKTEIRSQQDSLTLVCSLCPALSHWSLRWWCFCPWKWLLWSAW